MGAPKYRPEEDIQPDIRPDLGVIQGGGESTPPRRGHLRSVGDGDDSATYNADPSTAAQELSGDSEPDDSNSVAQDEQDAIDANEPDDSVNYSGNQDGDGAKKKPQGRLRKLLGRIPRRNILIGGTAAGFLAGGMSIVMPFFVGPLEFIHFAQSLSIPHMGISERASQKTLARFYRYITARGTSTCSGSNCLVQDGGKGDTRLNWLERRYKKQILGDIEKAGFKMWTDKSGNFKGWRIDTQSKSSPFKDLSAAEVKEVLEKEYGVKKASVKSVGGLGALYVENKAWTRPGQNKLTNAVLRASGFSKMGAWVRTRNLGKFANVGFHPMTKIDQAFNKWTEAKWKALQKSYQEKRAAKLKNGSADGSVVVERQPADEDPNAPKEAVGNTEANRGGVSKALKAFAGSKGGVGTAQALNVVGYLCIAYQIYEGAAAANYAQNVLPLMRLGVEQVSTGNQVESSIDFDTNSLDLAHDRLESVDENGNRTDWSQAKSIRQNNGQKGGTDLDSSRKSLLRGKGPEALAWTKNAAIAGPCGNVVVQFGMGAASVALGIASGGTVSVIASLLAGPALAALGVDPLGMLSKWLAGDIIDVAGAKGVTLGQYADQGMFLASNLGRLQRGGRVLSAKQTAELVQDNMSAQQSEFASQSIAYRLFNTYDKDTLISKAIDAQSSSASGNLANMTSWFTSIVSSTFENIGSILSPSVYAAEASMYDYGIPLVGKSLAEQDNALTENPYENAAIVGSFLDTAASDGLKDRAKRCNGVEFYKDTESGWGVRVLDAESAGESNFFQRYLAGEMDADCASEPVITSASTDSVSTGSGVVAGATDDMWTRMRGFIDDTAEIEAYACLHDDSTSCENSGFSETNTTYTSEGTSTSAPDGAFGEATLTRSQGSWGGYKNGKIPTSALMSISSITASDGTKVSFKGCTTWMSEPYLNPSAAVSFIELNKAYKAAMGENLKLLSCYRTYDQQVAARKKYGSNAARAGTSNHGWGLAIDFDDMSSYSGAGYKWLLKNGSKYGWVNPPNMQQGGTGPHEPWHWEYARKVTTGGS